jgi:hypothetical protein
MKSDFATSREHPPPDNTNDDEENKIGAPIFFPAATLSPPASGKRNIEANKNIAGHRGTPVNGVWRAA